jgi:uncharacterized protein (TIGR03435 family)
MRVAVILLALLHAVASAHSLPAAQSPAAQGPAASSAPMPSSGPPAPQSGPGAQGTPSGPAFEVATIKPSDPAACCGRTFYRNGRLFRTNNTNLQYLMQYAWGLQLRQITGGPAWMNQDRFDVAGEIAGVDIPTDQQWKEALQRLIADRFHIQLHREIRELPAYALVIANPKAGPKLVKGDGDPEHPQRMGFTGAVGHTMTGGGNNATLKELAGELQRLTLDRPVVDRTGLTGTFNIRLQFTRDDPQEPSLAPSPDDAAPTIFEALQQQLGLKLEPTKAPVEVLVVDHAEQPSLD